MKHELFVCDCGSVEHQMIFTWFEDQDDRMLYASVHLVPLRIWKRLWYAIKYIFGYKSKYGAFEEFIFDKKDAEKLQKLVNYLKSK